MEWDWDLMTENERKAVEETEEFLDTLEKMAARGEYFETGRE